MTLTDNLPVRSRILGQFHWMHPDTLYRTVEVPLDLRLPVKILDRYFSTSTAAKAPSQIGKSTSQYRKPY